MNETRKPEALSLQARAAMIRRAQSRRRTVNVNRTPNAPLAPSMEAARDALETAWAETTDARPEHERKVKPLITRGTARPKVAGRDVFGPVFVQGKFVRYGVHYRTRLVGAERVQYVRKDAWARERSQAIGEAKVQKVMDTRTIAHVRAHVEARTSITANGGFARIWTAPGDVPQWRDRNPLTVKSLGDEAKAETLWAERWGVIDGLAYRFEFNRETGEMRRPRA